MPFTGDVQFDILDGNGAVAAVPSQTVQAVIGPAIAGTDYQVTPTRSLDTLRDTFTGGPMMEAAGMVVAAGGTVLAVKVPSATAGLINGAAAVGGAITDATNATPIVITTTTAHGLIDGAIVTIAAVGGNTAANGTWEINATGSTTFELKGSAGSGAYTSGGTTTATGSILTAATASTGIMYLTGTPNDTYYVMVVVQTGFTQGTAGGSVLISLDAGRSFGPAIAVGTGATLALSDSGGLVTGLTLNFSSTDTFTGGGIVNGSPVGDTLRASTVEPQPNTSGISSAITALKNYVASSAAVFPILQITGNTSASEAATIQTAVEALAPLYLFERALVASRDASPPAAWSGTAETETTWLASINADFAATVARRVCVSGGYYNMPSAFPTQFAGLPIYRRPAMFALGARETSIPTQTHAGKVGGAFGGAISQIAVSPLTDARDGFIYHDEYITPSLDYFLPGGIGRFAAVRTHPRKAGWFFSNPLTLAAQGSDFTLLPKALTMDVACTVAHSVLVEFIASDFTTKPNGTLSDSAAGTIKAKVYGAFYSFLKGVGMISDFTIVVDQATNLQVNPIITVTISIQGVIYVLQINVPIGYATTLAA